MQYAIGNQISGLTIPILTVSYGGCEAAFSSSDMTSLEASLMEANAQGQTVLSVLVIRARLRATTRRGISPLRLTVWR